MPTETTAALSCMSELSTTKLRSSIRVTSPISRIPDHGLTRFRISDTLSLSDMDNLESDHEVVETGYESLPESSTFTTHMMAGAIAGIMEHCVMYPVDCVKVKLTSTEKITIY